ncbi:MAG: S4 domain-containing protein [Candidatus Micrarchaeia archaeon]
MASKGNSRHVKSLNAPRYFGTPHKEYKYVVKPNAGRHNLSESIALLLAIRKLNPESRNREIYKLIKSGEVQVNGQKVVDPKFPIGISDIVSFKSSDKKFTLVINKQGKSELAEGVSEFSQLYKVIGKYKQKGNKIMIRLHDGRIIEGQKDISVNDSVKLSNGKVEKHIKMGEGARCFVFRGNHVGSKGIIRKISPGTKTIGKSVIIESESASSSHETFETLMRNIMVYEA